MTPDRVLFGETQVMTTETSLHPEVDPTSQTPENYYQRATNLALQGKVQEAIAALQQALQLQPNYPEAQSNLGALLAVEGRVEEAIDCYHSVLRWQADLPEVHNNLGLLLQRQGNLEDAIPCFEQAIVLDPNYGDALINLGLAFKSNQSMEAAEDCFKQAIELNPQGTTAYHQLGTLYKEQGKLIEAEVCYRQALQSDPTDADGHRNLGVILTRQGRLDEAVICFEQALQYQPDFPEVFNNLGIIRKRQGDLAEAADFFRRAIQQRPHYALAHRNLGDVLALLGQVTAAIESYQQAIQGKPSDLENWSVLCHLLAKENRLAEALGWCERGLEFHPDASILFCIKGNVCSRLQELEIATQSFRQALELNPTNPDIIYDLGISLLSIGQTAEGRAVLRDNPMFVSEPRFQVREALSLPPILASVSEIDEERARLVQALNTLIEQNIIIRDPLTETPETGFYLAYHGKNDRAIRESTAQFFLRACPDLAWTAPHCRKPRPTRTRLRIGFCSAHLRGHTIGKLYGGLLSQLPTDQFEVVLLRVGNFVDEMAERFAHSVDRVVQLEENMVKARQQIAEQELDILLYTDIGMEPVTYFLAFSRLAPVQCLTWGHPSTTGIPNLDYFLSAEVFEAEEAQDHYSETLVRLHHPGIYFTKPAVPPVVDRAFFDLPEQGTLYLCPQSSFKFHPEFDEVIGKLLRRDPQGYFVLLQGISSQWDEQLKQRWAKTIPDVMERICFVRRLAYQEYLQLLRVGDVMLDPIHFGGGNTSLEALAMELPIVTWPGSYLRNRLTYGFYQQMGLADCVVWDADTYVETAYRLAHDLEWQAQIRHEIQTRSEILYENQSAVSELTQFFRQAIAAYDERDAHQSSLSQTAHPNEDSFTLKFRDGQQSRFTFLNSGNLYPLLQKVLNGQEYPLFELPNYLATTIVDIGAHMGAASLFFREHFPKATIYAFEPSATNFHYLAGNVANFSTIHPHPYGLFREDRTEKLYVGHCQTMQNSILPSVETSDEFEEISLKQASCVLKSLEVDTISILKVDTEGCEVDILRDLADWFPKIDFIYLEYHSESDRLEIEQLLHPLFCLAASHSNFPHRGSNAYVSKRIIMTYPQLGCLAIERSP
ncbi:MAG: FkbM family methyltransferase [Leptolyngbyaceae cyanobacterium bins.302]|nr:FkbM family methyltransferase [Leptolyngbyaceae cyanobacterium bins.302]